FSEPGVDDYSSNVKSPMTSGRVETTIQKLRKLNLQFVVRPKRSTDLKAKRKAKIIQLLINNEFRKGSFKYRLLTWWKDALFHPMSFMQVYYLKKTRWVQKEITDSSEFTKEEKVNLKKGKINRIYREEEIVDYDGIALEPCKFNEIYVDPSARYI